MIMSPGPPFFHKKEKHFLHSFLEILTPSLSLHSQHTPPTSTDLMAKADSVKSMSHDRPCCDSRGSLLHRAELVVSFHQGGYKLTCLV